MLIFFAERLKKQMNHEKWNTKEHEKCIVELILPNI